MSPESTIAPISSSPPVSSAVSSVNGGANVAGPGILSIILICVLSALVIIFGIIAISTHLKNKKLMMQLGSNIINPAYGVVPGYTPATNVCAKCGAMHAPGAGFCPNCGSKL